MNIQLGHQKTLRSFLPYLIISILTFNLSQAQYSVSGRQLKDPNGANVRIIGANVMTQYWDFGGGNLSIPELAKTGANAVRIFWQTTPDGDPARLRTYIEQAIDNKMIPIVALWDATGKSLTSTEFNNIMSWWLRSDTRVLMEEYEDYIILNIANEAGFRDDVTGYTNSYKTAITQLRNAGYDCPIMLDAPDFADDYQSMLDASAALVNHDPQSDLLFSWHRWRPQTLTEVDQVMNEAFNKNICFIVGEFGPSNFDATQSLEWKGLLARANAKNFGWLAWVWWNPAKDIDHSITTNGIFGNWKVTDWSSDVALYNTNSFQNRAVRTPWLLNGSSSGGGTGGFTITAPTSNQSLTSGQTFTAQATAPSGTTSVTFWYSTPSNDWNYIGQDSSAPYQGSFIVPSDITGVRARANGGPNDGQTLLQTVSTGSSGGGGSSGTYEGESATASSGVSIQSTYADFGGNGTWLEWNNVSQGSGSATLTFSYFNGSSGNRQCEVKVNGSNAGDVSFAPTGGWSTSDTASIVVTLGTPNNTIRITANTGSGGPNLDKMLVTNSGGSGGASLYFEAEEASSQSQFSPFTVVSDSSASGGQYIVVNSGDNLGPSTTTTGRANYDFNVDSVGPLDIWVRVNFSDGANDSFYWQLSGNSSWSLKNGQSTSGWQWVKIADFSTYPAGNRQLRILYREDGAKIDRIFVTLDNSNP